MPELFAQEEEEDWNQGDVDLPFMLSNQSTGALESPYVTGVLEVLCTLPLKILCTPHYPPYPKQIRIKNPRPFHYPTGQVEFVVRLSYRTRTLLSSIELPALLPRLPTLSPPHGPIPGRDLCDDRRCGTGGLALWSSFGVRYSGGIIGTIIWALEFSTASGGRRR